jgi:uncharacterized membrane protein YdfJ with MMPL/SSD domain
MAWVFQDGHPSGPLDFTATGRIDAAVPILMFCVAFGLSMGYEVFLLSRIEGSTTTPATHGLGRPGARVRCRRR